MLQKLPTFFNAILFSLCATSAIAASISFAGPTEVCPAQDYTYTASASNIFGSRNGQFEWTFWRGNQLIGSSGLIMQCPGGGSSTSTFTFNWGSVLGPVKIRVRFKGANDPLCMINSPDEKWIDANVRVFSPGPISGLAFCGPNETRTLSVPGISPFNSAQSCYYHYKYDWIVPSGWSVIPTNINIGYDNIPGGIRTFATSVRVTSQATPLATRYDGNYNITVKTEPAWPWPIESTGKIWVGKPPANSSTLIWTGIRGVNPVSLNVGSLNYYQVDNVATATSYSWSLPRGFTAYGSSTTTTGSQISVNTTNQVGTYLMLCRANNACGSSWTNSLTINVIGGGGGGGIQMRAAYPNPADDTFTVKVKEEDSKELAEVSLFNKSMERVYFSRTAEKEIAISTASLSPGSYYLKIVIGKSLTQHQIVISH